MKNINNNIKMPVDKFGRMYFDGFVHKFGRSSLSQINDTLIKTLKDILNDTLNDTFLRRDGKNTAIGTINMTGNTLTNMSNPVRDNDTANKIYVDENVGVSKDADIMKGNFDVNNFRLTSLPSTLPQSSSDAISWSHAVELVRDSAQATSPRKMPQGYVPTLRSGGGAINDKFGFIVTASSYLNRNCYPVYAFNNVYKPQGNASMWKSNGETRNFWIQIECPLDYGELH